MSRLARRGVVLAAVAAAGTTAALPALAPAASKHGPHQAPTGKTRTVGVFSDYYDSDKLTIHVGDRVRWVWHASGFALHDVYVDEGPEKFHSETQASGDFTRRFKKPGRFKLYCTQHDSMTMTLTVKRAPK